MRVLIILVAVVILLAFVGWITFSNDPGQSSIILDKEAIEADTREMLNTGEDLIDRAKDSTRDLSDGDRDDASSHDSPSRGTPGDASQ